MYSCYQASQCCNSATSTSLRTEYNCCSNAHFYKINWCGKCYFVPYVFCLDRLVSSVLIILSFSLPNQGSKYERAVQQI